MSFSYSDYGILYKLVKWMQPYKRLAAIPIIIDLTTKAFAQLIKQYFVDCDICSHVIINSIAFLILYTDDLKIRTL
jgi:hypothetical protein